MAYRALYREWRPKTFSQVVGQKAIMETLRNQVMGERVAHAYLFCGSRGTGKTSTAKILSRAINCLNPRQGDPCCECESCKRLELEETTDVIEIDAASNNGVDEMRNLRENVKYPPQFGKYKVYIIDEVHMLSASAFNALLKTLEEPPAYIVFILATTEPQKLPETILSRCQRFDFGRISVPEIAGRLREAADGAGASATDGALTLIARSAEGGMRDALSILDMCLGYSDKVDEKLVRSVLGTSDTSFLFRFTDALAEENVAEVFRLIDQLMREGKDPAVFAKDVCHHIRSLLIARSSPDELARVLDVTEEDAGDYIAQGERFTLSRLMMIMDQYMALETDMRYSSTPRLALENASLKCCRRFDLTDVQALADRITELEKRLNDLNGRLASGAAIPREAPPETPREAAPKKAKAEAPAGAPGASEAAAGGKAPAKAASADAWNETMNRLKRTGSKLLGFLSQGRLVSSEGDRFVWQPNDAQADFYGKLLNAAERKKEITDLLLEITGRPCDFAAIPFATAARPAAPDDSAFLGDLKNMFGASSVIEK